VVIIDTADILKEIHEKRRLFVNDLEELHCNNCDGFQYGCRGCDMREKIDKIINKHSIMFFK
jgi:hypothetical protein